MTFADFFSSLETELDLTGHPFDRDDLFAFAECVWPLAEDEPGAGRWRREFLDALPIRTTAEVPGPLLGFCPFTDGTRQPIYADGDRQYDRLLPFKPTRRPAF